MPQGRLCPPLFTLLLLNSCNEGQQHSFSSYWERYLFSYKNSMKGCLGSVSHGVTMRR